MATCLRICLEHSLPESTWVGPLCWTLATWRSRQTWPEVYNPGGLPQLSVACSVSQGGVDHALEREGGIINNNANKKEKTKLAGPEHFLNKEISLILWLI